MSVRYASSARSLDLFTDITVDCGIPPMTDAYNAAIFACACSSNKLYVSKAFRLAKEIIDGNIRKAHVRA